MEITPLAISLKEKLLSVSEAVKIIPGRPHLSTVWRWISNGVGGVRLETVQIGGRRYTSIEAIERFIINRSRLPSEVTDVNPAVAKLPDSRILQQERAFDQLINGRSST